MFKIHASLLHDNKQRFAYEAGWLARLVGKLKLLKLVLLYYMIKCNASLRFNGMLLYKYLKCFI